MNVNNDWIICIRLITTIYIRMKHWYCTAYHFFLQFNISLVYQCFHKGPTSWSLRGGGAMGFTLEANLFLLFFALKLKLPCTTSYEILFCLNWKKTKKQKKKQKNLKWLSEKWENLAGVFRWHASAFLQNYQCKVNVSD